MPDIIGQLISQIEMLKNVIDELEAELSSKQDELGAEIERLCDVIEAYMDTHDYNIRPDGERWVAEFVQRETGDAYHVANCSSKAAACRGALSSLIPSPNEKTPF